MNDPRIDKLIDGYIDDALDDEQFETLCDWLREDAAHRQAFARRLGTHSAIAEWCTERSGSVLATSQAEPEEAKTTSWIDELSNLNEQAESPATPQLTSVVGYALRKALTSRPAYQAYAAAAVLMLAVTLFFVFTGRNDNTNPAPDLATIPGERNNAPANPSQGPAVATLTAEHDAVWASPQAERASARGSLTPGTKLHPNDRLTLTAGVAEITTNNGAIAILEAPATIELIDNNNALRLHAGKLVGICETDSSKGFLVRTPHLDVTDLGTRFGIDATDEREAEVHVIDGRVEVAWQSRDTAVPQREIIEAKEAIKARHTGVAQRIAYDGGRFVTDSANDDLRPRFAGTNAVWLGQLMGDMSQDKRESDALQVFIEQRGLLLNQAVAVDCNAQNEWEPLHSDTQYRVAAGERVDVYLLHFDLINGHDSPEIITIDFGRPILGVIGSGTLLNASDAQIGSADASYPGSLADKRGLNTSGEANSAGGDKAWVDADGTVLHLQLWGSSPPGMMDQVRVIVRADEQAP